MAREVISPWLIERVPDFAQRDYPIFHDLIRHFYELLEMDGNFLDILNKHRSNKRISTADEEYVIKILSDYGFEYRDSMAVSRQQFAKNIFDFYLSAGSIQSFEYLFRSLFDSSVRIAYPREQMLVPSAATYVQSHFIYTSADNLDTEQFKYIQNNVANFSAKIVSFSSRIETAIESIEIVYTGMNTYLRIGIFKPRLEFIPNEVIEISIDNYKIRESVKNILKMRILDSGTLYTIEDRISISGAMIGGSARMRSIATGGINSVMILGVNNLVDGEIITTRPVASGFGFSAMFKDSKIEIFSEGQGYTELPILQSKSKTQLEAVTKDIGGVLDIEVTTPFVDFRPEDIKINIQSAHGTGFKYEVLESTIFSESRRITDVGVLGVASVLTDSFKYQQFSYLIISETKPSKYIKVVNDYLHPTGYLYFPVLEINFEGDIGFKGDNEIEFREVKGFNHQGAVYITFQPVEFNVRYVINIKPDTRNIYNTLDNTFDFVKFDKMFSHPIKKYYDLSVNKIESKEAGITSFNDAHDVSFEVKL